MNCGKVDNSKFPIFTLLDGKFYPKSDKGIFIRYLIASKAYTVYNFGTLKVEESVHLIESFVELNIKELQTISKEPLLDDEPKNWQMKTYHPKDLGNIKDRVKIGQPSKTKLKWLYFQKLNPKM
ncbi:hypothetical protein CR513_07978, partial [Mucuna pruriens]